jgi:Calx-beta domain/FG-GAP-like repeat/FG-GAP repeat
MSFNSWLHQLRSALAPVRGPCHHGRRGSHRAGTHRLNIDVLEDRSVPAFLAPVDYAVGANPYAVATGHFNEDDHLDLVTANYADSTVSVLLGNADGTFQPALTSAAGANPHSIAVGDFDADGNLDLAAVNGYDYGSYVSVMLGNDNGSFQAPSTVALDPNSKPTSVATGDFNEDGLMDLAVTSNVDPYYPGDPYLDFGQASVLLSIGDGSFSAPRTAGLLYVTNSAVVADFNGDGNLDLAAGTYSSGAVVRVMLGDGQGSLALQNTNWLFDHGMSMAAGDVDGDGDIDLVAASGYDVKVRLGNGLGGFDAPPGGQSYAAGIGPISIVLGDFNRDGVLDIATANYGSNDVSILRGKGGGTFWNQENFAAGPVAFSLTAGDFNGDGWLDVATANVGGNSASVLINDQSWGPVPPLVSVSDATAVTEGNTGAVNATFTLTLLHASTADVTVHYQTADINAAAGSDYAASSGDVVIPAGQTSGTFTVAVSGDRLAEPTETFAVNLTAATNATIDDGRGIGTILDNEPRIRIGDMTKKEGNGRKTTLFTFTVTLSAVYDQAVTMSYQTGNGTATSGDSDYIAKTGTLTFAPGETTKTITIEVKGDNRKEANETFYLDLFGNSGNSLITKSRGLGTIWNDD